MSDQVDDAVASMQTAMKQLTDAVGSLTQSATGLAKAQVDALASSNEQLAQGIDNLRVATEGAVDKVTSKLTSKSDSAS
jgi:hypothetical protein